MQSDSHAFYMQQLTECVLEHPGEIDASLRTRLKECGVAHLSGQPCASAGADAIPPILEGYVEKVALHAYKITDQDIQVLKAAGYSEDIIFEITLCVALGAGMVTLEHGLRALRNNTV